MSRLTKKERSDYLKINKFCVMCGKPSTEVHHVKMIQDGGGNEKSNLRSLCHACHVDSDDHAKCAGRLVISRDENGKLVFLDE